MSKTAADDTGAWVLTHAPFICSLTGLLSALFVALARLAQGYRDRLLLWLASLHLGFDV